MAIFLITQRLSFSGGDLWRFYQGISYTSKETVAIPLDMHTGWRELEDILMRMKDRKLCCQYSSKLCRVSVKVAQKPIQQESYIFVSVGRKITPGIGEKYNTRAEPMYTKDVIGVCAVVICRT